MPARPRAVAGTISTALLLFGGRWANYIGVYPIFLSDVLFGLAIVNYLLSRQISTSAARHRPRTSPIYGLMAASLLWTVLRFLFGRDFGVTAFRDLFPYLYISGGILAWHAVQTCSRKALANTTRIIYWAIGLHAAWHVSVILFVPGLPGALPLVSATQALHIFQPRADFDGAITGVACGLLLRSLLLSGSRIVPKAIGLILCWLAIGAGSSRAGLLSALLVSALIAIAYLSMSSNTDHGTRRKQQGLVLVIPVVICLALIILPSTTAGSRLLGGFSSSQEGSLAEGAAGTQAARSAAWGALLEWILQDSQRALVGVGFGPNFMIDSGASQLLISTMNEGADLPRSPHMYWLGTWARLGLIGLMPVALATIGATMCAWRAKHWIITSPLAFVATVVPISLIIPATLGVILESPFGAVPFWWCVGALFGLSQRRAATASSLGAVRQSGSRRTRSAQCPQTPTVNGGGTI